MLELITEGFDIESFTNNVFNVVLFLIVADIVVGLLVGAKERKLNSSINFVGLIRKFGELLAVVFLTFIDTYLQVDGKIVSIGVGLLIAYETMSIIENFARIGVNIQFISKYFDDNKTGGN